MQNEIDLLDELDREERDERFGEGKGGAGAAIGVALTLMVGCGLVFAAYKLGQRTELEEPAVIAAADGPVRVAPENPGGTEIANTGSLANAMVDGTRPALGEGAIADGVVAEGGLPVRELDVAATEDARAVRREIVQLDDLASKSAIEGEPRLVAAGPADRSAERRRVEGAEVLPSTAPAVEAEAEAEEEGIEVAATGEEIVIPPAGAAEAPVAAAPAAPEADAPGSVETRVAEAPQPRLAPLPPRKPRDLSVTRADMTPTPPRAAEPLLAPETRENERPVRRPVEPAVVTRVDPRPPRQPAPSTARPAAPTPPAGVRQVAIPPQPMGDAQVQLGAFPSPDEVRRRWADLKGRHRDVLGQLGLQVQPMRTGDGRQLFRMRVGPLRDGRMAAALCGTLQVRGVPCFVPQR